MGPSAGAVEQMLKEIKCSSLDELVDQTIPSLIRQKNPLKDVGAGTSEMEALEELRAIAQKNKVFRSLIGLGYSDTLTPPVILRNVFENPGWYTQYTPYQAEIAQGRLEALLNYQTLITDLTGLEIANASLLDEATAVAEAMGLAFAQCGRDTTKCFFVSESCHPQTLAVVKTRARPLGVRVITGPATVGALKDAGPCFGVVVQYPTTWGSIEDYRALSDAAHALGALMIASCDLLSLTLLTPPGEWGADIAVGNTQRFGVPLGFGGPHAAFFATKDAFKRNIPGRLVGVSKDAEGKTAIRLALQTREQHIRREKATSNICTAQVLLAVMASMYAVYHGPERLVAIARRVNNLTKQLAEGLAALGISCVNSTYFDTLTVEGSAEFIKGAHHEARNRGYNFRVDPSNTLGVSLDERSTSLEVQAVIDIFRDALKASKSTTSRTAQTEASGIPAGLERKSAFLTHPVFNSHHSETEMLRYLSKLQSRDLSLAFSMIPLGSCTMKLNATAEMIPVGWTEFSRMHPFVPADQRQGYEIMLSGLEKMLAEITGFDGVSLQPNAGSQGEYAGLLTIRKFHESRGQSQRDVCLIPKSAHGTNPASAVMAGMNVVVVECDSDGNVDLEDLKNKARQHADRLAALMITYPSTHGVFEATVKEACAEIHAHGGQVYMDGANMNAQVGLCRPGDFGPDVCHLNLHKTFAIPHGGGGPGMGPICVKSHLSAFLPSHPFVSPNETQTTLGGVDSIGPVSAAPWGSASVLPISWMYIRMMGAEGLKRATQIAILNANYVAHRLKDHYPVLYRGKTGRVAHECIFDLRPIKEATGVDVEDVAKRLMDYGFHAPTVSFPVAGTIMVEPTESESMAELDRFCDAMISIREEIREIESGKFDRLRNPLKLAPHTADQVTREAWDRPYSRERAAFPAEWLRDAKFWPSVARINNVLGDRQLICTCPTTEEYA